jgi:3-isopropylmalate dehydrogenase
MERILLVRFEAGAYKWGPDLNWTDCLNVHRSRHKDADGPPLVGVLPGEGVGPEVINAALEILCAVVTPGSLEIEICEVGCIGREAEQIFATPLPEDVIRFCDDVFTRGGAILHGPGGGRFVYNLRNQFDLFFKISPLQIGLGVPQVSRLKPETLRGLDILVTRENSGGIYQGRWEEGADPSGDRLARHYFEYSEKQVRRFLHASARLAKQRRGDLTVVWKESGLPSISKLWRACAEEAVTAHGVRLHMVDIDLMAYRLVHEPQAFDVIAAPNLFGDILADLGAVLLGSRGVSFSGNYSETGASVYQTNHGSAFNLAGTDRANPAGQIFSVAMMLRESFGLSREATAIEEATRSVWLEGWRTEDLAVPGARIVGTREMGSRVAEQAAEILESHQPTGTSVGDEATAHPR